MDTIYNSISLKDTIRLLGFLLVVRPPILAWVLAHGENYYLDARGVTATDSLEDESIFWADLSSLAGSWAWGFGPLNAERLTAEPISSAYELLVRKIALRNLGHLAV